MLADAAATERFGTRLAGCCGAGMVVFLHGELGAGKTTLVRGFLRGRGYGGAVTSPTYTLVEPYGCDPPVYHFDLYRLADPEELEFIGARDYFGAEGVCLVEWPERGRGILPSADLSIHLTYAGPGRGLRAVSGTAQGGRVIQCLREKPA